MLSGNYDNFQRQLSTRSRPAVLEHIVNSAPHVPLYAFEVAGLQCYAGPGWACRHAIGDNERRPECRDSTDGEHS